MDKRVAGVVALLGFAFSATSRPAQAQEAAGDNTWFDDAPVNTTPAPAPSESPTVGPRQLPAGAAPAGPQAPGPQTPPTQVEDVAETDPSAITQFKPSLDPYGTWTDDAKYGTVWVPRRDVVGNDFAPYVSAGHWALTSDSDWVWQSDYPFGGVVFHYGRWVWVPGTGWAWVAGRRYANAWVNWRVSTGSYGYIGWAPMPPAWGWYGGYAVGLGWYPPSAYVFCHTNYAFSYRLHNHILHDRYQIQDVAANTRNYADGRVQHVAATPRVLPADSVAPRGPTLQSARIPASATPATRIPVRAASSEPRSPALEGGVRRFNSNGSRPMAPPNYQAPRPSMADNVRVIPYLNPSSYARPRPSYTAPLTDGYRSTPSLSPRYYNSPGAQYSAPSTRYSPPSMQGSYSTPTMREPSYRSAPSFSAPSFNSSPSFSAPSFHSAPSFNSSPSHSFQTPGRR